MKSNAKRRRTKDEIQAEKLQEEQKLQDIEIQRAQHNQMELQLENQRRELAQLLEQNRQLQMVKDQAIPSLLQSGLLKSNAFDGSLQAVDSWEEKQHILQ